MTDGSFLHFVPAALFCLWAFLHSLFADSRVKIRFESALGLQTTRWYRLVYVLLSVITLAGILWLVKIWKGPSVWEITGIPRIVLIVIRVMAFLALILASSRFDGGDFLGYGRLKGRVYASKLNISGPYRLVRHPLYTLGFPVIWAAPDMDLGVLAFSIVASLYLWLGTYHEERGLREEFGDDYIQYAKRVPRLIPWFPGKKMQKN